MAKGNDISQLLKRNSEADENRWSIKVDMDKLRSVCICVSVFMCAVRGQDRNLFSLSPHCVCPGHSLSSFSDPIL